MKVYLAGKVPKGDSEEESFFDWRKAYAKALKEMESEFIDPFSHHNDESDYLAVFGADCRHIRGSDLVIVNAEEKLGVGTSQEMLIAKYFRKPVVTVLPKESYHRRKNIVFFSRMIEDWVHPFIYCVSDFIVESVAEIPDLKKEIITCKPKDLSVIDEAIRYVEQL